MTRGKQTALMPGNEDKVGYWLTPPELMKELLEEFHFNYDACPFPRPAGFDGLKEEWGQRTWCNPPFVGSLSPWTRKAITESQKGKLVAIILPITAWIETLMEAGAEFRYMGRVPWCRPDGQRTPRPRYPSGMFILGKNYIRPPSEHETVSQSGDSASVASMSGVPIQELQR